MTYWLWNQCDSDYILVADDKLWKTLHAIILFLPNSINLVGFRVDLFFLNLKEYQNTLVGAGQFPTQYVHWNDCNGFFLFTKGHTETKIPAGSGVYLFSQYLTEGYVYEM